MKTKILIFLTFLSLQNVAQIRTDDTWKSTETFSPEWFLTNFNDSNWANSKIFIDSCYSCAGFQSISSPIWNNTNSETAFFRKHFFVKDKNIYTKIVLSCRLNVQTKIYLNGELIFNKSRSAAKLFDSLEVASKILEGKNVISVEVIEDLDCKRICVELNFCKIKLNISQDTSFCEGTDLFLQPNEQYIDYQWSTGESSSKILVKEEGEYWVKVTDKYRCKDAAKIKVTYFPAPKFDSLKTGDKSVEIFATGNLPLQYTLIDNYRKNYTQSEPLFENIPFGRYFLIINDINGCTKKDSFILTIPEVNLKIPNAFTPDDDGINDTWEIGGIKEFPKAEIQIFDQNGKQLANYKGNEKGWNGRFKTYKMPSGTYWYVIDLKGGRKILTGHLTIIR